jgi:hypothetical protein
VGRLYSFFVLEFRASHLLGKHSTTWATLSALFFFALVTFWIESHTFCTGLVSQWGPPTCASHYLRSQVCTTTPSFLPRLTSNQDPPDRYLLSSWDYRHAPPCLPLGSSFYSHAVLILLSSIWCSKVILNNEIQLVDGEMQWRIVYETFWYRPEKRCTSLTLAHIL